MALFAIVEGVEAVGLWLGRSAGPEYLTFIATTALAPAASSTRSTHRFTPLKVLTLIINLAVCAYLIYATAAVRACAARGAAERRRCTSATRRWPAVERAAPA